MAASNDAEREIAESVAALAMLRQQICGMYAALQERGEQEAELAERLEDAEGRLQTLLEGLPRDPLTLASIQQAAGRVEQSAAALPAIVRGAVGEVGKQAADGLARAVGPQAERFVSAASTVDRAATNYERAVRWANVQAAALAFVGNAVLLGLLVWWWVPSQAEIQRLRTERAELAAAVEDLERRGGKARLNVCGDKKRLCVLVNEGAGSWIPTETAKGQAYRVIQGY